MPANRTLLLGRRRFLQAGTLALLGGAASAAQAGALRGARSGKARHCILVYLLGGPPHQDMWDLKPEAPEEIRGPFQPIDTAVSGLQVCEHLPLLAGQADKLAVVRSLTYPNHDHPFMTYYTLTGRVSRTPLGANTVLPPSRSDDPHLGSVVSYCKHDEPDVPGYVAIPEVRVRMKPLPIAGGGRAGFLGPRYDPLAVNGDPSLPPETLRLPEGLSVARFQGRQKLLATLEGRGPRGGAAHDYGQLRDAAARLLDSSRAGELFLLQKEPQKLRERYGAGRFGQSLLLARRLIERGVSFVGVHFNYMSKCDGWDTHAKNFECLQGELLPMLDQGLSALLCDLESRGLLDETLVVALGEFGRTPKVNSKAGRDHWGHCSSAVLAGGGVRGGNVVGASDAHAAWPTRRPVGPPDLVASIYHALGLAPDDVMHDALGRPVRLSDGRVIEELF